MTTQGLKMTWLALSTRQSYSRKSLLPFFPHDLDWIKCIWQLSLEWVRYILVGKKGARKNLQEGLLPGRNPKEPAGRLLRTSTVTCLLSVGQPVERCSVCPLHTDLWSVWGFPVLIFWFFLFCLKNFFSFSSLLLLVPAHFSIHSLSSLWGKPGVPEFYSTHPSRVPGHYHPG